MTGVRFDDIHSYDDLGLVLTGFEITPPTPKTYRVSIPGADGDIDLSEALTGDIRYQNRTITLTFGFIGDWRDINSRYSRVMNALHGRRFGQIVLDADVSHYYVGRVSATSLGSDGLAGTVKVKCTVEPYKYDYGDNWLWDGFNFETDVVNQVGNLTVTDSLEVTYIGSRMKYIPYITVSADMQVVYNGTTYSLTKGRNKILDIQFTEGENKLKFIGNGTVSIENKGGSL